MTKENSLKNNRIFKWAIVTIALFLDFGLRFVPAPNGMSQEAFGVIGILLGSLLLWFTVSIDWPSLLCILALGLLPSYGVSNALSSAFGNDTLLFLMFTFVCTYALSKTTIIKRVAITFISNKWAKKSGWAFAILFMFSALVLGMFMSPTVLFVIMMPILTNILEIAKIEKGEKIGTMMFIGLAFAISISSGMTPVAHVFPVLAMQSANVTVGVFEYMAFAVPVGLVCFGLMLLSFKLFLRPDVKKLENLDVSTLKSQLSPITLTEKITLAVFGLILTLWILPSLCKTDIAITIFVLAIMSLILILNSILKITKNFKNNIKILVVNSLVISLVLMFYILQIVLSLTLGISLIEKLNQTSVSAIIIILSGILMLVISTLTENIKKYSTAKNIVLFVTLALSIALLMASIFESTAISKAVKFISSCKTAFPPLVGTILLCAIRVDGRPIIKIDEAFKNIPWSSLMMCAGTLCLGTALSGSTVVGRNIGLVEFIQTNLQNSIAGASAIALIVIFVLWALIQTNVSSNMVTATLVASVASTIIQGSSSNVCLPAIVSIIGMLSADAFATPPSMPHIAITASSGYANAKQVLTYGLILMFISFIVSVCMGYPLATLILRSWYERFK